MKNTKGHVICFFLTPGGVSEGERNKCCYRSLLRHEDGFPTHLSQKKRAFFLNALCIKSFMQSRF